MKDGLEDEMDDPDRLLSTSPPGFSPLGETAFAPQQHGIKAVADPEAVVAVAAHFDQIVTSISGRMNQLIQQTLLSSDKHHQQCLSLALEADKEMHRLQDAIDRCEEIGLEFAKIKRIGEIVKEFKDRVAVLEKAL